MAEAEKLVEIWRGPFLEGVHRGHAVVCNASGEVVASWGDPTKIILPRSSCKMVQALPLIESGAADLMGLSSEHLALACASHQGAPIHTERVTNWLASLGLSDADLLCGPQVPSDRETRIAMYEKGETPCQIHNNCSGKHTGFLAVAKHLNAGLDYVDPGNPVQLAVKDAFETVTGETSPGFGVDGCSAPNFACSIQGLATAMARFAVAREGEGDLRQRASARLVQAMVSHPDLVAGEKRACTDLMRAMEGATAVKTGAEAVFVAILPEQGLGVALKIDDGASRASESAITALLVRLGVADAAHPLVARRLAPVLKNRAGHEVGFIRPTEDLFQKGARL